MKLNNAFSQTRASKIKAQQGSAGYDNARENIDPHIKTKVISTKETTLSDASGAGFVKNDANGVLSGGNAGGSGGDVTAGANLTDETIVQGDGGAKGVKTSTATVTQITNNVTHTASDGTDHSNVVTNDAKVTNVSTDLSAGTLTATTIDVNSSDGTNATLVEADTTNAGLLGSAKWDEIVANTSKSTNVTTNLSLGSGNATTEIIVCSDGTNVTLIEADTTNAGLLGAAKWDEIVVNTTHAADNTQAHTDYLLNSGADIAVGPITITADNSSADTAYVPMILYNTDATPPAASGFPIGTLYVQYTA